MSASACHPERSASTTFPLRRTLGAESKDPERASLCHAAPGSSHEHAIPALSKLGWLFISPTDSSTPSVSPLATWHRHRLIGTMHWENSLRQHGCGQFLGILRLRANDSGEGRISARRSAQDDRVG